MDSSKIMRYNGIQVTPDSYECSITTDVAIFGFINQNLKILLIKKKSSKFQDLWMLPGGAMDQNETLDECVEKILFSLTGLKGIFFEQVKTYGAINRHPIKRVVTVCFYAIIKPENHDFRIGENVENIRWFNLSVIPKPLGYDHEKLLMDAENVLKSNLETKLSLGELLPEKFTLKELQDLYEGILKIKLDKRNFRRSIFLKGLIKSTGEKKSGVKGGPLLYKLID